MMDRVRNEYIRETEQVEQLGDKEKNFDGLGMCRGERQSMLGERMPAVELTDRRRRGKPKRMFMDMVKEDVRKVGVTGRCRDHREMEQ